jgi:hypothetical protein
MGTAYDWLWVAGVAALFASHDPGWASGSEFERGTTLTLPAVTFEQHPHRCGYGSWHAIQITDVTFPAIVAVSGLVRRRYLPGLAKSKRLET